MDVKKLEKNSTSAGVVLLVILAVFGILGCLDVVFRIDFFTSKATANVWMAMGMITCVLIFCCFVVSTMINVSRIASSVEKLVDKQETSASSISKNE